MARRRTIGTAWALAAALVLAGTSLVAAQDSIAAARAAIAGPWRLNHDLTAAAAVIMAPGDPSEVAPARGRRQPPGPDVLPPDDELESRMYVLRRDMVQPPERLAIVLRDDAMVTTDEFGNVRTFPIGRRRQTIEISGVKIRARTSWSGIVLTQELQAGPMTLTRRFETTDDSTHLRVTLRASGEARGLERLPLVLIYERE